MEGVKSSDGPPAFLVKQHGQFGQKRSHQGQIGCAGLSRNSMLGNHGILLFSSLSFCISKRVYKDIKKTRTIFFKRYLKLKWHRVNKGYPSKRGFGSQKKGSLVNFSMHELPVSSMISIVASSSLLLSLEPILIAVDLNGGKKWPIKI